VSLAPLGYSAAISSVTRIVAFGSDANSLMTSSAIVTSRAFAVSAGTSTVPWNDLGFGGATGPEPLLPALPGSTGGAPVTVAGVAPDLPSPSGGITTTSFFSSIAYFFAVSGSISSSVSCRASR